MTKQTKAIITIAIIAVLVLATVSVIVLFNAPPEVERTTLTSGMSSYSLESSSGVSVDTTSVDSATEKVTYDSTPEQEFVTRWNYAVEQMDQKKYRITSFEMVGEQFILAQFADNDINIAANFSDPNELALTVVGADSNKQLGIVARIAFAQQTEEFENDTLGILMEQQEEVSVSLSGYSFTAVQQEQEDKTLSATMRLEKTE